MPRSSSPQRPTASSLSAPETRRNGIQVVARVGDVMRALAAAPEGLGLTELAATVRMPKSTVHRLVSALELEEFVTSSSTGKIHLGRGIARIGAATRDSLRDQARPFLLRLHQVLEETVDLSIQDGTAVRFIDHIPAPHRLRAVSAVGAAFPLHCTANGKALLATMRDEEVAAVLPSRLTSFTPHTITSRRELAEELERIRATGVAYDREEHTLGICAVGAVVRDPYGPVGAISVPVPAQRFEGNEAGLARCLGEVCEQCTEEFGG